MDENTALDDLSEFVYTHQVWNTKITVKPSGIITINSLPFNSTQLILYLLIAILAFHSLFMAKEIAPEDVLLAAILFVALWSSFQTINKVIINIAQGEVRLISKNPLTRLLAKKQVYQLQKNGENFIARLVRYGDTPRYGQLEINVPGKQPKFLIMLGSLDYTAELTRLLNEVVASKNKFPVNQNIPQGILI